MDLPFILPVPIHDMLEERAHQLPNDDNGDTGIDIESGRSLRLPPAVHSIQQEMANTTIIAIACAQRNQNKAKAN